MAKRGRPVSSRIRDNVIELLYFMGKGYGYEVYKHYCELFPKATMRSIYYQLSKGVMLGEIALESVKNEPGEYSWGGVSERVFYKLGPNAKPKLDPRIKAYFDKKKPTSN